MFSTFGLELPVVHSGWFAEIPADEYPNPIAFAFLDGDFYSSVRKGPEEEEKGGPGSTGSPLSPTLFRRTSSPGDRDV